MVAVAEELFGVAVDRSCWLEAVAAAVAAIHIAVPVAAADFAAIHSGTAAAVASAVVPDTGRAAVAACRDR